MSSLGISVFHSDEDIPTDLLSPTSDEDVDVAAKDKSDEIRIGPMTRARAKLLNQQVNSLLVEPGIIIDENFILPKSMHLCMIRFEREASMARGGDELDQKNKPGSAREEREEDASQERRGTRVPGPDNPALRAPDNPAPNEATRIFSKSRLAQLSEANRTFGPDIPV